MNSLQCMYMIPKEAYDVLITKGDDLTRETLGSASINQLNKLEVQDGANVTINSLGSKPSESGKMSSPEDQKIDEEPPPEDSPTKEPNLSKEKSNLSSAIVRQNILANESNPHFSASEANQQLIDTKFHQPLAKNVKLGETIVEPSAEIIEEAPIAPPALPTPKKKSKTKKPPTHQPSEKTQDQLDALFPHASSVENRDFPSQTRKMRLTRSSDEEWKARHAVNYKE